MLLRFIYNYYPELKQTQNKLLDKLLEYGVQYYNQFILPEKKYDESATRKRKDGFKQIIVFLKSVSDDLEAEEIPNQNI